MEKPLKKPNLGLVMVIYLLGIFMGALDTGIVTPARTIIQNNLNVDAKTGIWIITIYTLAYAASIPIMGKLADKFGRKYIYLSSISLFGIGSLFCGLSQLFGGFPLLIAARVVQAIGGGGIMPVATAEFGTTFPKEKRGMALGLVGGVYGIANVFGASAGSAILDLFGKDNWSFIFFVNVPITLFIIVAGCLTLKNNKTENTSRIDVFGILVLTMMILSLLYGLKNIDFFDIGGTIGNLNVYPFLLLFIVLLPIFVLIERKAQDPVMNLKYFTNRNIVISLIISFISGFVMMGMIFVPQFSENALKIASGSGGYLVIILGLFAGLGAPISGKLIDKYGAKLILGFGFTMSIIGAMFLVLVTAAFPNMVTVIISLMMIGIGIGFTMGTPLNYMMLVNTDARESNSSLATLSLVRSIGTSIAPAIMIGFVAHAGASVQTNVMNVLPSEVTMPALPYAAEITEEVNKLKENPNMKDQLANVKMPDLSAMQKVEVNMSGDSDYEMPGDLLELMQSSDVTTITQNTKTLADRMFGEMTPAVIKKIESGIGEGITGVNTGVKKMTEAIAQMQQGYNGMGQGTQKMKEAVKAQEDALAQLQTARGMLRKMGNRPLPPNTSLADMLPAQATAVMPQSAIEQMRQIESVEDLNKKIAELQAAITTLNGKIKENEKNAEGMSGSMKAMQQTIADMNALSQKMTGLKQAIPGAFDTAKGNYLKEIDQRSDKLESAFQTTMNGGFKDVYLTSAIASVLALLFLILYSRKREAVTVSEKQ